MVFSFQSCEDAAYTATYNLKESADNFEIFRRVVFINGITDNYIMTLEGYCSIEDKGDKLEVTVKTGPGTFSIHYLGLSDNVTYLVEQMEPVGVSQYHFKIRLRPAAILPTIILDKGND
jgi:hypothetical protein